MIFFILTFQIVLNFHLEGNALFFYGDFCQILPIVPKGSCSDIVHASLNSSYLWHHCKVLTLTKNMRLKSTLDIHQQDQIKQFAEWILKIGNGELEELNDGEAKIKIPKDLLIKDFNDPIKAIVEATYPSF